MAIKWYNVKELQDIYPCSIDNDSFNYWIKELYAFDRYSSDKPRKLPDFLKYKKGFNNVSKDFYPLNLHKYYYPPYDDHGRLFESTKNKHRAYIYHTYYAWNDIKDEVFKWAKIHNLRIRLLSPSFYNSDTTAIMIDVYV